MKLSAFLSCVAVILLAGGPGVDAFWRLLCHGILGTARIDPIVNFGQIAPHAHNIAGASNFGMFTNAEDLQASNCTSCEIVEDKSVYWTPSLYFQHDNGSFELVQTHGGMTVYYFNNNVAYVNDFNGKTVLGEPLAAFPPNFRMIAGNNSVRDFPYIQPDREMSDWNEEDSSQPALAAKSLGFNCMHYNDDGPNGTTEGSMEFHNLRDKDFLDAYCYDGVRFELEFPSCWDGVNLDSEDHKSHIQYPQYRVGGACPPGYNVRTPVMFFETIWATEAFVNYSGTFVIANGDTTGYGYHGDFYSGWNETFLQEALNTCTNTSGLAKDCPMLTLQVDSIATNCFLDLPDELRQEDYQGPMSALPGNVIIAPGPGLAPKLEGTPATGTTGTPAPTALPSGSTYTQHLPITASISVPWYSADMYQSPGATTPVSNYTTTAQTYGASPTSDVSPISDAGSTSDAPPASDASPPSNHPATTAASSSMDNPSLSIMSTSTYTSDGHEVHLIIFEEIVTVTDVVGPTKRHAHKHARVHGHDNV